VGREIRNHLDEADIRERRVALRERGEDILPLATTVWPSGLTTTVFADRISMYGAVMAALFWRSRRLSPMTAWWK